MHVQYCAWKLGPKDGGAVASVLIHMQNNDIFTTGTSWFFCRKCPHLSHSTHVRGCPCLCVLVFLSTVWVEVLKSSPDKMCLLSFSAFTEKVCVCVWWWGWGGYMSRPLVHYTTTMNNPLKKPLYHNPYASVLRKTLSLHSKETELCDNENIYSL